MTDPEPLFCTARILELHELPVREKYQRLLNAVIKFYVDGELKELMSTLRELEGTT